MKRWLSNIVEYSKDAMNIEGAEDSIEICPEIGKRVVFIPKNTKDTKILNEKVIQLVESFCFDDGKEIITITKDNYKDYDIDKILVEKPEKYIEEITK